MKEQPTKPTPYRHYGRCGRCGEEAVNESQYICYAFSEYESTLRQATCSVCGAIGPYKRPGEWQGLENEAASLKYG